MENYTTTSLLKEINHLLAHGVITDHHKIIVPNEQGLDTEATHADFSSDYEEFNIEPVEGDSITIRRLVQSLMTAPSNLPIFVWNTSGGKMSQAFSIGINSSTPSIRIY